MKVNMPMTLNKMSNIMMSLKRKSLLQAHGIILWISTLLLNKHYTLSKTRTSRNRPHQISKVLLHPNNKTNSPLVKIHRLLRKCLSTSSWYCLSIKLNKIDNMSNPYLNNKVLQLKTMKNPKWTRKLSPRVMLYWHMKTSSKCGQSN